MDFMIEMTKTGAQNTPHHLYPLPKLMKSSVWLGQLELFMRIPLRQGLQIDLQYTFYTSN